MLIAQQKRTENIAEYLLYMWQVEDIIRACGLDIDRIDNAVISQYDDEDTRREVREWYESLIIMMQHENKAKEGHLQINENVLIRLRDLHRQLLHSPKHPEYGAEFYKVLPFIVEIRAKVQPERQHDELETCFDALYGTLMLRLQHKPMSEATQNAIAAIGHFVGTLAAYFKKNEEKPIFDDETF